jgi:hypothetical protein
VARTQDIWGAEGISGRVKFLLLAWAGMPKTSFRKNSDSPPQLRLIYALQTGEQESGAKDRTKLFADALTKHWQQCDCDHYALTIEQEIVTRENQTIPPSAPGRVK